MAFQQPQHRPQLSRQLSAPKPATETQAPVSPAHKRTLEESQEWILFSPQNDTYSEATPRTATQPSTFGSIETHIRSQVVGRENQDADQAYDGTEADDDGAELDSLDDGLHAFHHPFSASSNRNLDQSGGTVLPMHDGFGTFPSSAGLQERLWQFERHNPHRRKSTHARRRSSVLRKFDAKEEGQVEADHEDDKMAWIEKWRLEQSRAVLEEIEKETRRRRRRMSRMSGGTDVKPQVRESRTATAAGRPGTTTPEAAKSAELASQPSESFWQRITRRVIQDLIGIDENTLSVIFGEALPEEDPSPTPTAPSPIAAAAASESRVTFDDPDYSWEVKLLDRIARELGGLMHQLYEHDGRAFTTYLQTGEVAEYAAMPIPERETPVRQPSLRQRTSLRPHAPRAGPSSDMQFEPTLPHLLSSEAPDSSLWGIEEEPSAESHDDIAAREYWERDIDVNMIFDYLKRRFSRPSSSPSSSPQQQQGTQTSPTDATGPVLPASWTTAAGSAQTTALASASALHHISSLRRADFIRQQHLLVSRAAAAAQSSRRRSSPSLLRQHLTQKREMSNIEGSCASQSTKRSRRSGSSSRHYWLDGSLGSEGGRMVGSVGAESGGGLGAWGDV